MTEQEPEAEHVPQAVDSAWRPRPSRTRRPSCALSKRCCSWPPSPSSRRSGRDSRRLPGRGRRRTRLRARGRNTVIAAFSSAASRAGYQVATRPEYGHYRRPPPQARALPPFPRRPRDSRHRRLSPAGHPARDRRHSRRELRLASRHAGPVRAGVRGRAQRRARSPTCSTAPPTTSSATSGSTRSPICPGSTPSRPTKLRSAPLSPSLRKGSRGKPRWSSRRPLRRAAGCRRGPPRPGFAGAIAGMTQGNRRGAHRRALSLDSGRDAARLGAGAPASRSAARVAAVLMDATTGTVLFDQAMHQRRPIASTTKIMTALLALESSNLDEMVTIAEDAIKVESPGFDFTPGERMAMNDLLAALLLKSANNAAIAIADHISGSVPAFAEKMNERAVSLGLKDTHFANPHGLCAPDHYSSAYDLAVMTQEALNYDRFREIVAEKMTEITRPDLEREGDHHQPQQAALARRLRGRSEDRMGARVGALPGRLRHQGRLAVDRRRARQPRHLPRCAGAAELRVRQLSAEGLRPAGRRRRPRPRSPGASGVRPAVCQYTLAQVTGPGLPPAGRLQVSLKTAKAPVAQGEAVGEAQLSVDGQVVASSPLLAGEQVPTIVGDRGHLVAGEARGAPPRRGSRDQNWCKACQSSSPSPAWPPAAKRSTLSGPAGSRLTAESLSTPLFP